MPVLSHECGRMGGDFARTSPDSKENFRLPDFECQIPARVCFREIAVADSWVTVSSSGFLAEPIAEYLHECADIERCIVHIGRVSEPEAQRYPEAPAVLVNALPSRTMVLLAVDLYHLDQVTTRGPRQSGNPS